MTEFFESLAALPAVYAIPLKIVIIIAVAIIVRWILLQTLRRSVNRIVRQVKESRAVAHTIEITQSPLQEARMVQRTRTLGTVGRNFITWSIVVATVLVILTILGVNIGALLASAGFIAAGLAFGAQNLVKDLLNGIFIVFEDQLGEGDSITVGDISGTVESIGLRVTQIRASDGTLWFVRNGDIMQLGNHSYGWSKSTISVDVGADDTGRDIPALLTKITQELARTPELARKILEMPEILGVDTVRPSYITYLITVKTRPNTGAEVSRLLRAGIMNALRDEGVGLGPELH